MGSRMAARLLEAGNDLTVWDRDRPNVAALERRGARAAFDPVAILHDADVVVTMLWDDAVAEAIVERSLIPAASPGTTFIEMTTITPVMQRRLAAASAGRGCPFLDAPVTGSKEAAERGELTALVGGAAEVLEANRDVLSAMASRIVHVGPNGASGALKLANNQLIALMGAAWGESVATACRGGVDRRLAIDLFANTFGRVAEMKRHTIARDDYQPHFTLDALLKDIRQALATGDALGVALPVLQAALPFYEAAAANGDGPLDFSIIVQRIAAGATAPREATR
jgi:3-hydroxyisobutyrate dehydrogenase